MQQSFATLAMQNEIRYLPSSRVKSTQTLVFEGLTEFRWFKQFI